MATEGQRVKGTVADEDLTQAFNPLTTAVFEMHRSYHMGRNSFTMSAENDKILGRDAPSVLEKQTVLSAYLALPWPPSTRQECQRLHQAHRNPSPMDLNVCSRRVHDGYATIRSRGRNRPRAVYRSDSEELLKEAGGPYALPQLSNFPIASNDLQQVPRWTDFGNDCLLIENYGTLRGSKKANLLEDRKPVTLNTFSKVEQGRGHLQNGRVQQTDDTRVNGQGQLNTFSGSDSKERKQGFPIGDRVYDTVCTDEYKQSDRTTLHSFRSRNSTFKRADRPHDTCQATIVVDPSSKRSKGAESFGNNADQSKRNGRRGLAEGRDEKLKRIVIVDSKKIDTKDRQPIYAVPNILSKTRRDRRIAIVDGNYVPSGDLYRTTAKYIEDINRNIAEIDKSYEELKSSSNSKNSAYGVINKIAKGELADRPCNLYGYARKRDMAPMPPISSDFGENFDEKPEKQLDSDNKTEPPDNSSIFKSRPNSFGKLPPKLLPRSSSIENTSRHSTGSTTTSSTKSTESLYAISESLASDVQRKSEPRSAVRNEISKNPMNFKQGPASTEGSDELESKDEMSSTDDDRPTIVRSVDRLSVTSSVRKNRSRVDSTDRSYPKKDRLLTMSKYDGIRRPNGTIDKNVYNSQLEAKSYANNYLERRYDTLPSRRSRVSSRPLHKSSEDVLDGERLVRARSSSLHRPCTSDIDVSDRNRESFDGRRNFENIFKGTTRLPFYLMDATDIILHGQIDRTSRSFQRQDHFLGPSYGRTRHNSLESEETEEKDNDDNCRHGGFATLPRRGNLSKDQASNDPLRRLSGNVPILEPLYEHAVSDPVKPRSTENIIPCHSSRIRVTNPVKKLAYLELSFTHVPIPIPSALMHWGILFRDGGSFFCGLGTVSPVSSGRNASRIMLCSHRVLSGFVFPAHVVSAFEQSLSNMTQRLQQLTATAEKKVSISLQT
ncbi:hypothetical protein WN48_10440 [Eufriesea mexicana]|uniref:Uncharacterized protein n=1 Tax=Eufriesea mexicana TaxID=516756 RepID=A0A310S6P7_9HYME|nr:hypothetical protein WN48_10440 [Eufriesea mexicana]